MNMAQAAVTTHEHATCPASCTKGTTMHATTVTTTSVRWYAVMESCLSAMDKMETASEPTSVEMRPSTTGSRPSLNRNTNVMPNTTLNMKNEGSISFVKRQVSEIDSSGARSSLPGTCLVANVRARMLSTTNAMANSGCMNSGVNATSTKSKAPANRERPVKRLWCSIRKREHTSSHESWMHAAAPPASTPIT